MKHRSLTTEYNQRAADIVVEALENRILTGQLPDGRPLPAERDLMEEFGTSRTVIREAISALSNRGLLEAKPRFRPVVRKPNFGTVIHTSDTLVRHLLNEHGGVENLYHSRIFVEVGLVRHAAVAATKQGIADLKQALKANEDAIEDSFTFYQTDMAFHGALYKVVNNPIFPAIHQGYISWLSPYWEKMVGSQQRNVLNFQSHAAIYDAILERDPDRAEQALRDHLDEAWEFVKEIFESEEATVSRIHSPDHSAA